MVLFLGSSPFYSFLHLPIRSLFNSIQYSTQHSQGKKKSHTFLTAPGLSCNIFSFNTDTNSCGSCFLSSGDCCCCCAYDENHKDDDIDIDDIDDSEEVAVAAAATIVDDGALLVTAPEESNRRRQNNMDDDSIVAIVYFSVWM